MGLLRAESIRTCRELGYVSDGDRVVSVDRALGKAHDAFAVAQTLKIYTVSAEGGERGDAEGRSRSRWRPRLACPLTWAGLVYAV